MCGAARVAVRWKAAAEDSDWHLSMKGWADARVSWPTIMSASLDPDHEADKLFQRGESL